MSEVTDPTSTLDPALAALLELEQTNDKNFIYCAACSHIITSAASRTEVAGQHEHHCVNPHGFAFHVGCFSAAPGCDISGSPEAADSWFAGYTWTLASCAGCQTHLGWCFRAVQPEHVFYGLILNRLQQDDAQR